MIRMGREPLLNRHWVRLSRGLWSPGGEVMIVRRLGIGLLAVAAWLVVFVVVWDSTGITDRPRNDNITITVAAACVAPGPSFFPALPVATVAAAAVGFMATRLWSRRAEQPTPLATSR